MSVTRPAEIDPHAITPREAFHPLAELKALADGGIAACQRLTAKL
jgi:hypothetical protein